MSKVTYLLGAGASFGKRGVLSYFPFMSSDKQKPTHGILRGLPILSEFQDAMSQLQKETHEHVKNLAPEIKDAISEILTNLLKVSQVYPTIDTYAKMLYTTKQHMYLSVFLQYTNIYK